MGQTSRWRYDRSVSATQQVEWHERVRAALDAGIRNTDFCLWISIEAETEASLDETALLTNVSAWLGELDVDREFEHRNEPEHTYENPGLVIRLTAVPRPPAARGLKIAIVGNAVAMAAYGSSYIRGDTGVPTRDPFRAVGRRRSPP